MNTMERATPKRTWTRRDSLCTELYDLLTEPLTVYELAEKTGHSTAKIDGVLRLMGAQGWAKQAGKTEGQGMPKRLWIRANKPITQHNLAAVPPTPPHEHAPLSSTTLEVKNLVLKPKDFPPPKATPKPSILNELFAALGRASDALADAENIAAALVKENDELRRKVNQFRALLED